MSETPAPRKRRHARKPSLITEEDYLRLLAHQNGVCAICGNAPKKIRLHVDHDHGRKDRRVRGLLCHRCNRWLPAWVRVPLLERAIAYLTAPPAFALFGSEVYPPAVADDTSSRDGQS